ncbi:hypothetical protein AD930_05340 [Acetobacter malorum]|nr:hypothetical protein AD930_05340 [Acetobacter malorum]
MRLLFAKTLYGAGSKTIREEVGRLVGCFLKITKFIKKFHQMKEFLFQGRVYFWGDFCIATHFEKPLNFYELKQVLWMVRFPSVWLLLY